MPRATQKRDMSLPGHDVPISQVGLVPNPDPTVRTVEQLQREIAATREILEAQLEGVKNVINVRLDGMDKANVLLQELREKMPDIISVSIKQLENLHQEKFHSIETQFIERDTRTEQTSRDSKVAVDAALQAAKEAVGEQNKSNALAIAKSEAAFTKQIDQLGVLITTMQKGIDDKIEDIKSRLLIIEGNRQGGAQAWGIWLAVTGLVLTAGLIAAAVFSGIHRP